MKHHSILYAFRLDQIFLIATILHFHYPQVFSCPDLKQEMCYPDPETVYDKESQEYYETLKKDECLDKINNGRWLNNCLNGEPHGKLWRCQDIKMKNVDIFGNNCYYYTKIAHIGSLSHAPCRPAACGSYDSLAFNSNFCCACRPELPMCPAPSQPAIELPLMSTSHTPVHMLSYDDLSRQCKMLSAKLCVPLDGQLSPENIKICANSIGCNENICTMIKTDFKLLGDSIHQLVIDRYEKREPIKAYFKKIIREINDGNGLAVKVVGSLISWEFKNYIKNNHGQGEDPIQSVLNQFGERAKVLQKLNDDDYHLEKKREWPPKRPFHVLVRTNSKLGEMVREEKYSELKNKLNNPSLDKREQEQIDKDIKMYVEADLLLLTIHIYASHFQKWQEKLKVYWNKRQSEDLGEYEPDYISEDLGEYEPDNIVKNWEDLNHLRDFDTPFDFDLRISSIPINRMREYPLNDIPLKILCEPSSGHIEQQRKKAVSQGHIEDQNKDCQGHWGGWTDCENKTQRTREYIVTQNKTGNGKECPGREYLSCDKCITLNPNVPWDACKKSQFWGEKTTRVLSRQGKGDCKEVKETLDIKKFSYENSCRCENSLNPNTTFMEEVKSKMPCQAMEKFSFLHRRCSQCVDERECREVKNNKNETTCVWKGVKNSTREKILLGSCNFFRSEKRKEFDGEGRCSTAIDNTPDECISELSFNTEPKPGEVIRDFVGADTTQTWYLNMWRREASGDVELDFTFARDNNGATDEQNHGTNRAEYVIHYFDSCGYKAATRRIMFTDKTPPDISWPIYNESEPFGSIIDFLSTIRPTAHDRIDGEVPVLLDFLPLPVSTNGTKYLKFPDDLPNLTAGTFRIRATTRDFSKNERTEEQKTLTILPPAPPMASGTPNREALSSSRGGTTASSSNYIIITVAASIVVMAIFFVILVVRKKNQPEDLVKLFHGKDGLDMVKEPREIPRTCIEMLSSLGAGAFGEVWKGLFEDRSSHAPAYIVAVKTLKSEYSAAERMEMLREAATTAQVENPYVVGLVGVITRGDPLCVVLQFCEHGALDDIMKKGLLNINVEDVLYQVAIGMECIHDFDFIHRDVAARNILMDSAKTAKIADFGLSRHVDTESAYKSSGGLVPVRWVAPEALNNAEYSKASDVWSFGILAHELFIDCEVPYSDMSNDQVWTKVSSGYRLPKVGKCSVSFYKLMLDCWDKDPTKRPSFARIRSTIKEICNISDIVVQRSLSSIARVPHEEASNESYITDTSDRVLLNNHYVAQPRTKNDNYFEGDNGVLYSLAERNSIDKINATKGVDHENKNAQTDGEINHI
eukprot:UC4_evm3s1075